MIDTIPKVGRIVLRISDLAESWIDRTCIGEVTAINGKQITLNRKTPGGTESRKLLVWKVAAVCDTPAEVADLLAINERIMRLHREHLDKRAELVSSLVKGEGQ